MVIKDRDSGLEILSAIGFQNEYTEYYKKNNSDSPKQTRAFLTSVLLRFLGDMIDYSSDSKKNILNIGAGKQILEFELAQTTEYQTIMDYLRYFTGDIAFLESEQLLAPDIASHVILNGSQLPFADKSMDVVFSCMAIDFMPRESFHEVKRVLSENGTFFVALHHPDLTRIATSNFYDLKKKLRTIEQKLKFGSKSKDYEKKLQEKRDILLELTDTQFLMHQFPNHIFHSVEEIYEFMSDVFGNDHYTITVKEFSNLSQKCPDIRFKPEFGGNGWFYAEVKSK